jgi:hypothetical protein
MPSYLPADDSPRQLIPPTPESDVTDSPGSLSAGDPEFGIPPDRENAEPSPPQRRKAGRKPLYKTAQERRDRNRRAQLAFRARRSDYLGRLEATCRSLENVVIELQESNRITNAALARERVKVRHLERMIQSQASLISSQYLFPTQSSEMSMSADSATGLVQPELFPQAQALINLDQFASSAESSAIQMFFTENTLGMLPTPVMTFGS